MDYSQLSQFILGSGLIGIAITGIINWIRINSRNNFLKFSYLKELEDIYSTAKRHLNDVIKNGLFDESARIIKHERIPFVFLDYIINQLPYIIRKPNFFAGMVRLRAAIYSYRELYDHVTATDLGPGLTNELKNTNQKLYIDRLNRIIFGCETQLFIQEETNAIKINPVIKKIFNKRWDKLPKEQEKTLERMKKQGKINEATYSYIKNKIKALK